MWEKINKNLKFLTSNWTQATAIGTVVLYFFGYLVLRYRLTLYGVGTDLEVLDERYFFEGVRFFVFFVTTIPIALLVGFGILLILYPFYFVFKKSFHAKRFNRLIIRWSRKIGTPANIAVLGIVLSLLFIQLFMRRCLDLNNVLMSDELPGLQCLHSVLLYKDEGIAILFYPFLLIGLAINIILMYLLKRIRTKETMKIRVYTWIFGFLILVQIILLPVNYGILIGTNYLPRISTPSSLQEKEGIHSWLLWEGKSGYTVFQCNDNNKGKVIVTLPKNDVKKTEIIAYDYLLSKLFGRPEEKKKENLK